MGEVTTYLKGIALGLLLFAAWVGAIVGICLAVIYIEYWFWVIFPAAFIVIGVGLMRERALRSPGSSEGE